MLSKIFQFVKKYQEEIILFIGVVLVSLLSFAAGYIMAKQQEKIPIKFEKINERQKMKNKQKNLDGKTSFIIPRSWFVNNL